MKINDLTLYYVMKKHEMNAIESLFSKAFQKVKITRSRLKRFLKDNYRRRPR